ncbi:hypothetical protein OsJ_01595 [Oryza sativa Japonica Group]|uniref:DUF7597 domain-containing protein n=1 Tax=Oryza sativa subsp. japonica TaxID=39947 RepID=B9EW78_ORYSJ|nr:hypothetical protein OsJ_01595 [Oryza sativa Japonica Group]
MASPGELVTPSPPDGWNFDFGKSFSAQVQNLFNSSVHFSKFFSKRPFFLVVDFIRFNFCLTEKSVAVALQSCLGGTPFGFHVSHLKNNSFCFQVCSKQVGFHILSFKNFISKDFHARFFLWRDGRPNWRWEFSQWQKEEADMWTLVSYGKNKSPILPSGNKHQCIGRSGSSALIAKNRSLSSDKLKPGSGKSSVFLRLSFPPSNVHDGILPTPGFHNASSSTTRDGILPTPVDRNTTCSSKLFHTKFFRNPRADFTVQSISQNFNDEFAAVLIQPQPPEHLVIQTIDEVIHHVTHHRNIPVRGLGYDPGIPPRFRTPAIIEQTIIEQQDDQLPFDGQIVPYGLPLPHLPLTKFPPLVCIAVAQGVFKPLLLATQPIIFRSVHSYPCWDLISIKWIIDIPKLPQLCPSPTCPSLAKKQKSIHPDGKRVAKVMFASSEITSDPEVRQGRARKHKIQTPVSTEGLRRSPRFTGLGEKLEIHTDTPKKKTKVKPMVTSFKPSKDDRVKHLPPAIPVAQLQKIGLEKCGLLLEEVADGKLLQNKDD